MEHRKEALQLSISLTDLRAGPLPPKNYWSRTITHACVDTFRLLLLAWTLPGTEQRVVGHAHRVYP